MTITYKRIFLRISGIISLAFSVYSAELDIEILENIQLSAFIQTLYLYLELCIRKLYLCFFKIVLVIFNRTGYLISVGKPGILRQIQSHFKFPRLLVNFHKSVTHILRFAFILSLRINLQKSFLIVWKVIAVFSVLILIVCSSVAEIPQISQIPENTWQIIRRRTIKSGRTFSQTVYTLEFYLKKLLSVYLLIFGSINYNDYNYYKKNYRRSGNNS